MTTLDTFYKKHICIIKVSYHFKSINIGIISNKS